MTDLENLFFELIRVAIGTQDSLTRLPSEREWSKLYKMAEKQSLVGVCFAGLQNLGADADEGFARIGISEMQYLNWMGQAFQIQQRNEQVDRQCAELQTKFSADGMRSCILKGQGVGLLYTEHLQGTRQSGDIDLWVDASRKEIMAYVQKLAPTTNVREHHLELKFFSDTEVEVHYWPAVIRHFLKNRKLQKWFDRRRDEVFSNRVTLYSAPDLTICAPTPEFHAVQQMAHMYHHLFDSGIGLRQVMDYYFVLCTLSSEVSCDSDGSSGSKAKEVSDAIKHIGMGRFSSAMMYVLQEVMGLTRDQMICEPNEEDGRFLLGKILRGGNFGRHDDRKNLRKGGYINSFLGGIVRNFHYLRFNPFDWFWSPLWRLYYFGWRKLKGYK